MSSSCPICYDDISYDQEAFYTFCGHCFHGNCIDKWLIRANTCPMCRTEIAEPIQMLHVLLPVPLGIEENNNIEGEQPQRMVRMGLSYRSNGNYNVVYEEEIHVR